MALHTSVILLGLLTMLIFLIGEKMSFMLIVIVLISPFLMKEYGDPPTWVLIKRPENAGAFASLLCVLFAFPLGAMNIIVLQGYLDPIIVQIITIYTIFFLRECVEN